MTNDTLRSKIDQQLINFYLTRRGYPSADDIIDASRQAQIERLYRRLGLTA
jgi:hypothetical protein